MTVLSSRCVWLVLLSFTVACAKPEVSPCQYVSEEPPPGSMWSLRDETRQQAYNKFFEEALQGLDGLTPEDLYTFVRQGTLGDFPVFEGDLGAKSALQYRYERVNEAVDWGAWTALDPEGKMGRLHLSSYLAAGQDFETLYQAALETSLTMTADPDEFRWRLCGIEKLSAGHRIPMSIHDWPGVESLWQSGAPSLHSVSYRHYRQPSYVVLSADAAEPLLKAIAENAPPSKVQR